MKLLKLGGGLTLGLLLLACAGLTVGVLYPLAPPLPAPQTSELLIRNLQLVDLASGSVLAETELHIADGEIVAVGRGLAPPDITVLDAGGRFAIPGLFDMHVHSLRLSPLLSHPLYVAAGVTAVRDMGGCLGKYDGWVACAPDKRHWNREVAAGRMVGPRYDQVTGLAVNGGEEIPAGWDVALGAGTVAGARQRVAHDAQRGIDFLKPYSLLPREAYFELAAAARERGLYLAGHRPMRVSTTEAIAAGQRSFEHALLFIWECFPGAAALRERGAPRAAYTHELREQMLAQHDAKTCDALFSAMAESDTAFVPTHTTRKLDAYAMDTAFRSDPRLRFIPVAQRYMWLADADGMAERTSEAGLDSYRRIYEFGLKQTGKAHAAGVTVLAGTDAPDSFVFPGSALHDELEHLVQAGLSPLDALRAATTEPARFLGLAGRAGVLEAGARADVVLLNSNPLESIGAVRDVDAVVLAGRVYDRARLDALLAGVESAAGHWSLWPKFIWQAVRSPILRAQIRD